jgi:hypothetical protein
LTADGHPKAVGGRLFDQPLVRELTVVLGVKLFLLAALWFAFFRDAGHTPVSAEIVSEALVGSTQAIHHPNTERVANGR